VQAQHPLATITLPYALLRPSLHLGYVSLTPKSQNKTKMHTSTLALHDQLMCGSDEVCWTLAPKFADLPPQIDVVVA
jgi:hypothetical protein